MIPVPLAKSSRFYRNVCQLNQTLNKCWMLNVHRAVCKAQCFLPFALLRTLFDLHSRVVCAIANCWSVWKCIGNGYKTSERSHFIPRKPTAYAFHLLFFVYICSTAIVNSIFPKFRWIRWFVVVWWDLMRHYRIILYMNEITDSYV